MQTQTEVLIVGAGPTGLTLACELQRRGINFCIIDKALGTSQTTKAIGVQPRTIEIFAFMGIVDEILAHSIITRYTNMFVGKKRMARFDYQCVDSPYPFLLSLPQYLTEKILLKRLQELGGNVFYQHELHHFQEQTNGSFHCNIDVDGNMQHIKARYLISCEGAKSSIRKQLKIPFEGVTYNEDFLFADVDIDWHLDRTEMFGWFHKDGLLAIAPMPQTTNWKVFIDVSEQSVQKEQLNINFVQETLRKRTPYKNLHCSNLNWIANFIVNHRVVKNIQQGNVFLAGDAAHIHSPLGGQGMNMGIQDAFNLAWKLAHVIQQKASSQLLNTYEKERLPVVKKILNRTHLNTKILTGRSKPILFFRNQIITRVLASKQVQKRWIPITSQLKLNYRNSPIQQKNTSKNPLNLQSGDRAPDSILFQIASISKVVNIYQLLNSTAWTLLIFDHQLNHTTSIQAWQNTIKKISVNAYVVYQKNTFTKAPFELPLLKDGNTFQQFKMKQEGLCLIRPDAYIAFYKPQICFSSLTSYINTQIL